jgi:hypothetical protein
LDPPARTNAQERQVVVAGRKVGPPGGIPLHVATAPHGCQGPILCLCISVCHHPHLPQPEGHVPSRMKTKLHQTSTKKSPLPHSWEKWAAQDVQGGVAMAMLEESFLRPARHSLHRPFTVVFFTYEADNSDRECRDSFATRFFTYVVRSWRRFDRNA